MLPQNNAESHSMSVTPHNIYVFTILLERT